MVARAPFHHVVHCFKEARYILTNCHITGLDNGHVVHAVAVSCGGIMRPELVNRSLGADAKHERLPLEVASWIGLARKIIEIMQNLGGAGPGDGGLVLCLVDGPTGGV